VKPLKELCDQLDVFLHEPGRLAIVATLAPIPAGMTFVELREQLHMTDGNLSVHLQKLEDKGYVEIEKKFVGRRPQTSCRLSKTGRKALGGYIEQMAEILHQARNQAARA
jgi:DNA-binding transcriptional ArsR family regulator